MKLLSSSFSSSSSSPTSSFDVNICNSKSATAGCLAGILRRILCSGTLPTHPSDCITEETNSIRSNGQDSMKNQEKILSLETPPGLVARLMGLESMPDVDFKCIKSRPNLISRSRSMNSTDRLAGFDDSKQQGQHHRRAKSTTAEFVELGNEEFFILSFENVSESREFRPKERKYEVGSGELRQRRTVKVRKAENTAEKELATTKKKDDQEGKIKVLSDMNGKETLRRSCSDKRTNNKVVNYVKVKDSKSSSVSTKTCSRKHVVGSESVKSRKPRNSDQVYFPSNGVKPNLNQKKKKKKKKNSKKKETSQTVKPVESESTSEDSSPVSVLDCGQFLTDPQLPISEEDSGSTTTSSRRKLTLEIETCERQCPRRDDNLMSEEGKTEAKPPRKKQTSDGEEKLQLLDKICRLSEADLFGSSNWVAQRWSLNHEELQSIGEELESQIFGQLVEEVVFVGKS